MEHTEACKDLLKDKYRVPSISSLTTAQREIIYSCPHYAHDAARFIAHRKLVPA